MSGRDLVDEMRSGVRPLGPAPQSGGLLDIIVGAVALIAVVSLGFVGFRFWFSAGAPPPAPPQIAAVAPPGASHITPAAWTKADDDACLAQGRAAAENAQTGNLVTVSPALTEGIPFLTTKVECQLTRKVTRFCAAGGTAQLVAIVNDYLGRLDLVTLGIGAQGAPMAIAGGLFGGEPAAGDAMYQDMAKDTFTFMDTYNAHVTKALRMLAREGVVKADDFNTGPFGGVPEKITKLFAGVEATSNICV